MHRDVFLSLLSMDSYNRGRLPGVNGIPIGNNLGTASVIAHSDNVLGLAALGSGFSATAYNWNGETVISYRGTDFSTGFTSDPFINDFLNGWSFFTGIGTTSQARYAAQFYEAVTEFPMTVFGTGLVGTATLVGHSLGGGLAGYVGSQSDNRAVAFDPIPFGAVALGNAFDAAWNKTLVDLNVTVADLLLAAGLDVVTGATLIKTNITFSAFSQALLDNLDQVRPDFSMVRGYSLQGEIAASITNLQLRFGPVAAILIPPLGLLEYFEGLSNGLSGDRAGIVTQSNRGLDLGATDLHSSGIITMILFGEQEWAGRDWTHAIKYILPAAIEGEVAISLGRRQNTDQQAGTGETSPGEQLSRIIAYSAINEGDRSARPFGDTGIRALFNDADDLGSAITAERDLRGGGEGSRIFTDSLDQLGAVITEYAGFLAVNRQYSSDREAALTGVATAALTPSGAAGANPTSFTLDLREETWTTAGSSGEVHDPQSVKGLVEAILGADSQGELLLTALERWYYSDDYSSFIDSIQTVTFSLGNAPIRNILTDTPPETATYLTVLGDGIGGVTDRDPNAPNQFDVNDIIISGANTTEIEATGGNDILIGNARDNRLSGGAGNDTFYGGGGQDSYDGGEGYDRVNYTPYGVNTARITITGDGVASVFDGDGTDRLTSVELVDLGEGDTSVIVDRQIGASLNLFVLGGGGFGQTVDLGTVVGGESGGINVSIDQDSRGSVANRGGAGFIVLEGFGTTIQGSSADDFLRDSSTEEKLIDAGDGDDYVLVNNNSGLVFGGEGDDWLEGGSGNDTIIDDSGLTIVDGGRGDDVIIVGSVGKTVLQGSTLVDWEPQDPRDVPDPDFDMYEFGYSGFNEHQYAHIMGGDGNDRITANAGGVFAGDAGDDRFNLIATGQPRQWRGYDGYFGPNPETDRQSSVFVYRAGDGSDTIESNYNDVSLNLIDIDRGAVSVSWAAVVTDNTNADTGDGYRTYGIAGTVTITMPGGDQIIIKDVRGIADLQWQGAYFVADVGTPLASFLGPDEVTDLDINLGGIYDILGDNGLDINLTSPASARMAAFAFADNNTFDAGSASGSAALSGGDDTVSYTPSDAHYDGLAGYDVFSIVGALDNYAFSFDGTDLIVSDRWGLVGTTRLTNFEAITSMAERRDFTLAEVLSELVSPMGEVLTGTDAIDDVIEGSIGSDTVSGRSGDDELSGLGGADQLFGGDGVDQLSGGDGRDTLDGGVGADTLVGGTGDDVYRVDDADDLVNEEAAAGRDTVEATISWQLSANVERLELFGVATSGVGNELANVIVGNAARRNSLEGRGGNDVIYGTGFDDQIYGESGNDDLIGGAGDDIIEGGDGDDTLFGDAGRDHLSGGLGNDIIWGGTGTNTFVWNRGDGHDVIQTASSEADHRLVFGDAISRFDLTPRRIGSDLRIDIVGEDGSITIVGYYSAFGPSGLNMIEFADGTFIDGDGTQSLVDNHAPRVPGSIADVTTSLGGELRIAIPVDLFDDSDGDSLILSVTLTNGQPLPGWLAFDGSFLTGIVPADFGEPLGIKVTARDNWALASTEFSIGLDANEPPTLVAPLSDRSFSEDTLVDLSLPQDAFFDPEGDTLSLTATLLDGGLLPDWLQFEQRRFTGTPPTNFSGTIAIAVTATDGNGGNVTGHFTLTISPVNDAPVLVYALPDATALEDAATSFALPADVFSDVDGDVLLLSATGLPSWLSFNPSTRTFTGQPPLNFNGVVPITVTASDGNGGVVSDGFALTIAAVNDTPTDIVLPTVTVAENSAAGTAVGIAAGADVDVGDTLVFSLADNAGGRFTINAVTGALTVANGTLLNFEAAVSHAIVVRVTDAAGASYDETFAIAVSDVNEAPATLSLATGGSVAENSANGTVVGQFAATDPDVNSVLSYGLTDNAGGRFAINAATGQLTVANGSLLDFETATSHSLTVRVTDQAGLSRDLTAAISITDVNEGVPYNLINGTNSANILHGTNGADRVNGLAGHDLIFAQNGNDLVDGGAGNDVLLGEGGNDILSGGSGLDTLVGGTGQDVFRYLSAADSPRGVSNRDLILDFNRNDDIIDLSAIDAKTNVNGDQTFNFIGGSAFSRVSGQLRYTNGLVSGDTNGDGVADFEILVTGDAFFTSLTLAVDDFVL